MRAVEKRLKNRIEHLEKELNEVTADRDGFRSAVVGLLKDTINIHGRSNTWHMATLIERIAQIIQHRKPWWW